jgi:hypothetical protein
MSKHFILQFSSEEDAVSAGRILKREMNPIRDETDQPVSRGIVGGVGGGINIDVSTLTSTLINNSKATMTNDKIIFAPALPTTRAIATGTTVCYVDNGSQNILLYATQFSELYPLVAPSLSAISEENGMGIYATMPSSAGVNNNLTAKINNFDAYILTGIRLGAGGGTYQWAFQPRYACILLIVGKASNDSTLTSVVQIKECHAPASTTWTTSEQSGTGLPEKMTLNGITEIPSIMKSFYQFQYQYYTNGYTPSDSATSGWTTLDRGGNWYASVPIQEAGRTRNLWVRYVCQFMDLTAYSKPTNLGLFTR